MPPEERPGFLEPEVVSKIGRLDVIARLVVEGFITGLHRSPYHGFSVEFSEHRPYMQGDPLRHVDWKALAKTDRLYVKRYEEETNLKSYLLLDASGSMGFQEGGSMTKFRYACCLASALAYLMLRQRDAVGLMVFRDRALTYVPPRSVQSHLHVLLKEIGRFQPQEGTRMAPTFHELAERLSRRGLVIVLSDLLDDGDEVLNGLRHFRHRGHEVLALQILDPRERDLEFESRAETRFYDLESRDDQLQTQPWHVQDEYRRLMDELLRKYTYGCGDAGIDYALLDTATPFDQALSQYLIRRRQLA
jgi:uncharacterized protein (DUF58 family)